VGRRAIDRAISIGLLYRMAATHPRISCMQFASGKPDHRKQSGIAGCRRGVLRTGALPIVRRMPCTVALTTSLLVGGSL
jgi:hypothetical protein